MKRIIIALVTIILTSTPLFLFSWYGNKKQEISVSKDNVVKDEVSTKIDKNEQKKETVKKEQNKKQETLTSEKSIKETENSTKKSIKEDNNSTNIPQESSQTVQSETQQQPASTEQTHETQPSVSHPWDAYGISEYEYYNKPLSSWERVDYSVSVYGSEQAAYNACATYGDSYEPYVKGEELYNCRTVVSASGRILGIMFSTEKLN